MKPAFSILSPQTDTAAAHLVIEAGPMGISLVILDENNSFHTVVTYSLPADMDRTAIATKLEEIVAEEPLFSQSYKRTSIIWSFTESILVPPAFLEDSANTAMLDLVFGDLEKGRTGSDFLFKHNLQHIYRVPHAVSENLAKHFPAAVHTHQYALLPELVPASGDQLYALFYNNSLTVVIRKSGNLQLIRNFAYSSPDDAAYHLLNSCENFDLRPEGLTLHLSGLIDEHSNCYSGIYKYFLDIRFAPLPADAVYTDAIREYPPHYFSHLFAGALCV